MRGTGWSRPLGACLVAGSVLAGGLNLVLPHDDDDLAFVSLVAESETWGLVHAGLFVAVLLVAAGLFGALLGVRDGSPVLSSLGQGALWVGTGLMLSGLLVAGVAMEKAADNFVVATSPEDRSGVFFSAIGFDRLSYSLFAGAAVVFLGLVPVLLGVALRREHAALGVAGIVVGAVALAVGLFEMVVRDTDTSLPYTVGSSLVVLWCLAVGLSPSTFGVLRSRQ